MSKSANTKATEKRKPPPTAWKKGQSGNPKGAPRRGMSWAELIKDVGELTPPEAAAKSLELSKQFLKIGDGVTLKEAVVLRVYGALLFDPNPGLLNAFMDRVEGKVKQAVELTVYDSLAEKLGITSEEAKILTNRIASGELTIEDVLTGKVKANASPANDG